MKKKNYSKRDYTKKIYLSGDEKDLRKSFPKWTMVAWALIDFIIGLLSLKMCYVHLSYLWGGKIWGPNK